MDRYKKIFSKTPERILLYYLFTATVLIIILGWLNWRAFKSHQTLVDSDMKITKLSDDIIYLDEVLTMSARLAASSGDLKWEKRYITYEKKLDSVLSEIKQISPEIFITYNAELTNSANKNLVAFEQQAFALIKENKNARALKILFSEEYETNKMIYSKGVSNIIHVLENRVQDDIKRQYFHGIVSLSVSLFSIIMLLIIWIGAYKALSKSIRARVLSGKRLKIQNEALQTAKKRLEINQDELEKLNMTKDKFFSVIGHDLRSPLANIVGFSELLLDNKEQDPLQSDRYLSIINSSARDTLELINNLLNWARSQRGLVEVRPTHVHLHEIVNSIIAIMSTSATQKNIYLNSDISEDIKVYADIDMSKVVLRNLISNAIKFTKPNGEIKVSAIKNDNHIEICVSDNGIGIDPDILEELFKFEQNQSLDGTGKEKGSGIGLVLCQEFIAKQGGKIWVESILGQGSDFKFTLPTEPV